MSRTTALVDADWVHRHLDDPHVVLIEVDEDTTAYDTNHIRGAVRIDWRLDLQDPVRRDFVDQDAFERLLSRKGVERDDTVVLYGGNNNWFAAFAYWYFKVYGHQDVRLLDGGRKKWELDGRELVQDVAARQATAYQASAPDASLRALRDDVLASIGSRNLVDVRSPEEFSGKLSAPAHLMQEAALQRGHIPTAVNVPWSKAAHDDGTFRSDEELAALYGSLDRERETIVYCRIGERSAHTWFVLSEVLGYENVRNYDGSWAEYGSLVGVPITLPIADAS